MAGDGNGKVKIMDLNPEPEVQRFNDTETFEVPECLCGHGLDDHDEDLECSIEECPCFAYDADEEE